MIEPQDRASLFRRLGIGAVAAAAGVVMLTGCATGKDAQTVAQIPAIDGVAADSGKIGVRDLGIIAPTDSSYAKGSDAALELVLINTSQQDVKLVSVSTPAADGVLLSETGVSETAASETASSETAAAAATGSETAGSETPGSETPGSEPPGSEPAESKTAAAHNSSSAPQMQLSSPIDMPASQSVQVGYDKSGPAIVLTGLKQQMWPAQATQITFTFSNGATITTTMTVKLIATPASTPTVTGLNPPAPE